MQFHPEPRDAARAKLGWPDEDRIVLFNAGQDPRNKRVDLARRAVDLGSFAQTIIAGPTR